MQGTKAIVMENMWNADVHSGTLAHEIAHHLGGETRSNAAALLNFATFGTANALLDIGNDFKRYGLRGGAAFSQAWGFSPGKAPRPVQDPWRLNATRFFGGR